MTDDEFDALQEAYDLCGIDGRLRDFAEAVQAAERAKWESALGAEMPADFECWHLNSPSERPAVAAWVIRNLREREALSVVAHQKRATFARGDLVRKRSGSAWIGVVVGEYSTSLTPVGYAVESLYHPGSVQIYPSAAIELVARVKKPDAELSR